MSTQETFYRGYTIYPSESPDMRELGLHWYIQVLHHRTGIPYASMLCSHYPTVEEAMEAINEWAEMERRMTIGI